MKIMNIEIGEKRDQRREDQSIGCEIWREEKGRGE